MLWRPVGRVANYTKRRRAPEPYCGFPGTFPVGPTRVAIAVNIDAARFERTVPSIPRRNRTHVKGFGSPCLTIRPEVYVAEGRVRAILPHTPPRVRRGDYSCLIDQPWWSGQDLNLRLLRCHRSTLAKLSYSPMSPETSALGGTRPVYALGHRQPLVEKRGIEPRISECKTDVLPLALQPHVQDSPCLSPR